ncbi:uncharacterized protein LOC120764643 isoform X5 [Hirundo rustica]|uniref:uncharacterized protein LOC120764643 isoform X5 n=1 Tax=Hirundo rustica TaxID=43150 RepID=UPI001A94EC94|nr:uncharacterized protein LOC120764643 isoform X5 [Hirundo rustica]
MTTPLFPPPPPQFQFPVAALGRSQRSRNGAGNARSTGDTGRCRQSLPVRLVSPACRWPRGGGGAERGGDHRPVQWEVQVPEQGQPLPPLPGAVTSGRERSRHLLLSCPQNVPKVSPRRVMNKNG